MEYYITDNDHYDNVINSVLPSQQFGLELLNISNLAKYGEWPVQVCKQLYRSETMAALIFHEESD